MKLSTIWVVNGLCSSIHSGVMKIQRWQVLFVGWLNKKWWSDAFQNAHFSYWMRCLQLVITSKPEIAQNWACTPIAQLEYVFKLSVFILILNCYFIKNIMRQWQFHFFRHCCGVNADLFFYPAVNDSRHVVYSLYWTSWWRGIFYYRPSIL